MTSITRDLRKDLEKKVKQARRVAEAGARQAVQQLRVGDGDAPKDLNTEERALRTRLRAHGRQLGDRRDAKTGAQETAHLVQECAYEHWHRMLFARFLAETDLLIEPESGVAITLDEVQELAREKATDWLELSSEYAERMLPQIFRKDDPVLQIALPPETRSEMEDLLKGLSKPVFEADDSLGWVYQFWQADNKDAINKSEIKIGADELPAVTQLFTEDYMVLFLLHNTLGAWWASKLLARNPILATSAADEDAVRAACKIGDIDWTYLRLVRDKAGDGTVGPWRAAAGAFEGWPQNAKDITVLDPCMGSGHFLVFALPILASLRMAEEGLSQSAAIDAALRDNLFGLEIDPRCTQIAAFNLAFAAWRTVGYRALPQLNLACSGLSIGVTKPEWLRLAEKAVTAADPAAKRDLLGVEKNLLTVGLEERVKNGLVALYDLFSKAPWLGSLIDPRRAGADIFREGFDNLEPLLASILATADTDDTREMAVAAQGMAKAAELLGQRFTLVITNVPFLGNRRQSQQLLEFSDQMFERSKIDLSVTMLDRLIASAQSITVATISPQAWLQQVRYRAFLENVIFPRQMHLVLRYGSGAFQTITGEVVSVCATVLSTSISSLPVVRVLDLSNTEGTVEKAQASSIDPLIEIETRVMREKRTFLFQHLDKQPAIETIAFGTQGVKTGDDDRFVKKFWELPDLRQPWRPYLGTTSSNADFTGRNSILRWDNNGSDLIRSRRDNAAYGQVGVAINQMGDMLSFIYTGEAFDSNVAPIICRDASNTPALLAFLRSADFTAELGKLEGGMKINNGTLLRVPFDLAHWRDVATEVYPTGLAKPYSNDPTQWIFDGHPCGPADPNASDNEGRSSNLGEAPQPLHVAVARLLGYRWPRQTGASFTDCEVVGADGLETYADTDGIVCLTALKGEPPAEQRLNALLANAFGRDWSAAKLNSLLGEVNYVGKSLDDWLRDGFFAQHCELFHQRPFIWHVWDGRRDGFHALVNYHRLAAPGGEGRRTLEKLIYSYLGDWIDRQRADQNLGVEGADGRLAQAEYLRVELIKILEGEPPYDIFVRWKALKAQPMGWDPDIDDGVRMNIRPFINSAPLGGKKGACILRSRPKGKEFEYGKDRGKEPLREKADYPWFWDWDEKTSDFTGGTDFDGNRWNDLHYSRAAKQAARDRQRASLGGKI